MLWDWKHEGRQVPWWLVGDEDQTEWVASYLALAAGMNHTGSRMASSHYEAYDWGCRNSNELYTKCT